MGFAVKPQSCDPLIMNKHVAIYARICKDRGGRAEGVKAQERWGRAYAARAWPGLPVRVYADNSLSAANGDHRPGYESLREAIRNGEVAHLWAVEQSRLERREVEWFALAAELDAAGIDEVHTTRDGIVRVRAEVAGIKAVLNAAAVRELKRRVNEKLDDNAALGLPAGGRVYGYERGRDEHGDKTLVIVEAEAEVIRECADRVLAGWALANIARDLDARGIRGSHGGQHSPNSVKSLLTNATVAGQRVHRGRITGPGVWPAILDLDTWNAVRDRLAGPRAIATRDGKTTVIPGGTRNSARRYLLSGGTAVCAVCGDRLTGAVKRFHPGRPLKPYYNCVKFCVGILAEALEAHVVTELLAELDKPAFLKALAADEYAARRDEVTAGLRGVDARRNELARMWAAGDLAGEEWTAARSGLDTRERKLRDELAGIPPPVSRVDPTTIRADWEYMTLDEKREIISTYVARVTVSGRSRERRASTPAGSRSPGGRNEPRTERGRRATEDAPPQADRNLHQWPAASSAGAAPPLGRFRRSRPPGAGTGDERARRPG